LLWGGGDGDGNGKSEISIRTAISILTIDLRTTLSLTFYRVPIYVLSVISGAIERIHTPD